MTRGALVASALAVVLTAVMTWPMAARPGSVARYTTNDGRFSVWNIAWVAHAVLDDRDAVFDANIFHRERRTLAYSETLLAPGVVWSVQKIAYALVLLASIDLARGLNGWAHGMLYDHLFVFRYSGFYSACYVMLHDVLQRFPSYRTLEELARLHSRYIVVHGELMPPARHRDLTTEIVALPSFRLV